MKQVPLLFLVGFYLTPGSEVRAAAADLIGLIQADGRTAPLRRHLESNARGAGASSGDTRKLKPVEAFGGQFAGELVLRNDRPAVLLMWSEDALMTPMAGMEVFEKLTNGLIQTLGEGLRIAEIPNYGDASEVKSKAVLWRTGSEVILIQLDRYPSRAGITIVKRSKASWRENMGADEGLFWTQTLESKAPGQFPAPQEDTTPSPSAPTPPAVRSRAPEDSSGTTPAPSKPGGQPDSSTSWTLMAAMIVAALFLLWLVLRARK